MERLQKILSARGISSRREAEQLILDGRVTVDGLPAALGQRADPETQIICVDGQPIAADLEQRVYIMLNKPRGYVTTVRDERGRKTVMDLLGDAGTGLWPVGRLDYLSQGLLLLTNDGEITRRLTHPSFEVEKVYHVWVRGRDIPRQAEAMAGTLVLDGTPINPAKVQILRQEPNRESVLEVRVTEGRNRQVRRMCALCDLEVLQLMRVGEGSLVLGDLKPGTWRHLTEAEITYLRGI